MTPEPDCETVWRPAWPCPVGRILGVTRRGPGDPTYRIEGSNHWRGTRTPQGVAGLRIEPRPSAGEVYAAAWGPGAEWAVAQVPALLGALDDPSDFEPGHPLLVEAWRRHQHWRFGRTGLVWESLLPAVIEQKVTGQEAFAGFRRIVRRFGERAPGPHLDLWVAPSPVQALAIPSWEWLQAHVDGTRSKTLMHAARVADSLERVVGVDVGPPTGGCGASPGIGVWTSAEVRTRALGDADAVSFGDYHVAKDVGWALTGSPLDDDGLAELLEVWRPHRGRVVAAGRARRRRPGRVWGHGWLRAHTCRSAERCYSPVTSWFHTESRRCGSSSRCRPRPSARRSKTACAWKLVPCGSSLGE